MELTMTELIEATRGMTEEALMLELDAEQAELDSELWLSRHRQKCFTQAESEAWD